MIANKFVPIIVETLYTTQKYQFFLTGSRLSGNAEYCTDWKFFTDETDDVRKWLVEQGFVQSSNMTYCITEEFQRNNLKITVRLIDNLDVKLLLQENLLRLWLEYGFPTTESEERAFWIGAEIGFRVKE